MKHIFRFLTLFGIMVSVSLTADETLPESDARREVRLRMENDSFISAGDNDYTHGTCIEYLQDDWRFKIGQNMYAPADLSQRHHVKGDRPYAGLLYGGIGREIFPWKSGDGSLGRISLVHYVELDVGIVGPSARCKETQKFVHKVLGCKDPKGWDDQLHDEPVANGQWWSNLNWYPCKWVGVVPRVGAMGGNLQDAVEAGCDVKVGWNLEDDAGNAILLSATRKEHSFWDDLGAWAFVGCAERYWLYNHMLEGSMFSHKDDGLEADIEPFVFEWRCGAAIRFRNFHACYYAVFREKEFRHQKTRPDYGGISLGWSF